MKALPLAYNRDLQEDKEGFFDTVDTILSTLDVFSGMVKAIKVNAQNARQALEKGYILATDLADYLVRKGAAFRAAHEAVAKLVSYAVEQDKPLGKLTVTEYKKFSKLFEKDVLFITIESSVAARDVVGGTAPKQVEKALAAAKKAIGDRGGR